MNEVTKKHKKKSIRGEKSETRGTALRGRLYQRVKESTMQHAVKNNKETTLEDKGRP